MKPIKAKVPMNVCLIKTSMFAKPLWQGSLVGASRAQQRASSGGCTSLFAQATRPNKWKFQTPIFAASLPVEIISSASPAASRSWWSTASRALGSAGKGSYPQRRQPPCWGPSAGGWWGRSRLDGEGQGLGLLMQFLERPAVQWSQPGEVPGISSRLVIRSARPGGAELQSRSFFSLLYRVQLAPAGEVIARDAVLFMGGGSLLLLASHTPFLPAAAPPDAEPLLGLPFADSITLHLVRLSDGVRVGGSRFERELVDLSGRPGSLGISVHEDLITVMALRSQVVHLLQVLRGGEEVVPVRSLGPHVAEDDELVLRTAAEAEERWLRARRSEREGEEEGKSEKGAAGLAGADQAHAVAARSSKRLQRRFNGDLVRSAEVGLTQETVMQGSAALALGPARHQSGRPPPPPSGPAAVSVGGAAPWSLTHAPTPPRYGAAVMEPAGGWTSTQQDVSVPALTGDGLHGFFPEGTYGNVMPQEAAGAAASAATRIDGNDVGGPTGTGGMRRSSYAATTLPPPPIAVIHPPTRLDVGQVVAAADAANGGRGGRAASAADLAAAVAQQAAVRRNMRQQQYEELVAQGGPGHPPSAQRGLRGGGDLSGGQRAEETWGPAGTLHSLPPHHNHHQHYEQQQQQHPNNPLPQQYPFGRPRQVQQPHNHHRRYTPISHNDQQEPAPVAPPPTAQRHVALQQQQQQHYQAPGPGQGRVLLPTEGGAAGGGGSQGGCMTGIKQRLLAHLYVNCLKEHPKNPRRQQREALALFRHFDMYRSLLMRKVYLLDRCRLLIDLRKPSNADLGLSAFRGGGAPAPAGGGPGQGPWQFFLLFDLRTNRVLGFEASPGNQVIESYIREVTSAAVEPWAESLPLWDRYVYNNVFTTAWSKFRSGSGRGSGSAVGGPVGPGLILSGGGLEASTSGGLPSASGSGGGTNAAAERACCAGKLMQLLPPLSGSFSLSSSPYLDTCLFNYDERVVSPYVRTRPCLEQSASFRLRNRPDRALFRLDPGPYEAMVLRDRRLGRNVTYLFHPDAPFVLTVFGVFQQSTLNINFRI